MKLQQKSSKSNREHQETYDHYFALDWSMEKVAIARMRSSSQSPKVVEMSSDLREILHYTGIFKGSKILAFEETTGSHWLYVELRDYFDKIIVCDPYRNSLLSEGAKNDQIDAGKLCLLLRGNLLKEVYHNRDKDYEIRKLVSAYQDLNKAIVRAKNQLWALYRMYGISKKRAQKNSLSAGVYTRFIEETLRSELSHLNKIKAEYLEIFRDLRRTNTVIRNLCSISGINTISAVGIYGYVIDPLRFEDKYKYWSYCGLVMHSRESGNRKYGRHRGRYHRSLKAIYKMAALAAIGGKNDIRNYYDYLLNHKRLSPDKARHAIARYIAKSTYGMFKNKMPYIPYSWRRISEESDKL